MFLRNKLQTIKFQLIASYSTLFLVSYTIIFSIIYYKLSEYSSRQLDKRMLEQLYELNGLLKNKDMTVACDDMRAVTNTSKYNLKFFRVYDQNNTCIIEFTNSVWKDIDVNLDILKKISKGERHFQTVVLDGEKYTGRVLYATLGDNFRLQMGFTTNKEYLQLQKIRVLFLQLLCSLLLPLAVIAGSIMACHATKDMWNMTEIAVAIKNGDFSLRMPIVESKYEIFLLATAFNGMLDQLQLLMQECVESADNIAHDLRSPLTRICGGIEVLLSKPRKKDEYIETLQVTFKELCLMQNMINTILDISSMESSVVASRENIDIKGFLEDVIDIFQYSAESKSIELELCCPENYYIAISKHHMKRALANLLDNAIKYTSEGGRVSVEAEKIGKKFILKVNDTGIGISAREVKRIFERFYRVDESRSASGSGLGLSLVQSVIDAHGGTVTVESELGKGSSFTIVLEVSGIDV